MEKVLTILLSFCAVLLLFFCAVPFFYASLFCSGLNPAQALYDRGHAYADKGDYDKAIEDYNEAIDIIKRNLYEVLNGRGFAYSFKDDYDRAIEDYNAALRIKPDDSNSLYNRGLAYYDKNDYDHAIEDFEAVLRIDPNDADAKKYLEKSQQKKKEN